MRCFGIFCFGNGKLNAEQRDLRDSNASARQPERLWHAITDTEMRRKYNFGAIVTSDWTPGSRYRGVGGETTIFEGENLEVEPPRYAHLPLLHGPDGKKLSKRHGAASVQELRDGGYLPEAVNNYIALLGTGFAADEEFFTMDEMARLFRGHETALAASVEIVERCRFGLDELQYEYPEVPVPPGMTPPRVTKRVNPSYKTARGVRLEGAVTVVLVVSSKGVPRDVRVAKGLDKEVDQSAIDAVREWRFSPALKDDQPIAVRISLEIDFHSM